MKCINCEVTTPNPRFCSRSCAASYNNKRTKVKPKLNCKFCGTTLALRNRTYCSNQCQANYTKKIINETIEKGIKVNHAKLRNYLIRQNGSKCMKCEWSEKNPVTKKVPIELDHIDGNSNNNVLNNVRLLCPNCQSLTPTYKALNKGNGRYSRMKRYKEGKSY